ncbi:MAG: ImmA/IrrE family metallo-endopeptidase [Phycisphaeraceae bacterium]|nr:ImmA/IrrE family metallo-endopeptidase [Phycisphaeraceae bacterium]
MTHAGASIPTMRLSVRAADARVELAAQSVIRTCVERLGLSEVPLPIPIDDWIERPLGYRFSVAGEEEMGAGVLGIARRSEHEILVSETLLGNEGRYRFTCAHELGHMTLHASRGFERDQYRDEVMPHPAGAPEVEREADRFAAAMLMPIDLLPAAFARIALEKRLHASCFDLLRGDDVRAVWLWRRCFIPALAERFAVSTQAMVYRCREVRLPGQKRLLKPSLIPLLVAPEEAIAQLDLDAVVVREGVPILN